MSSNGLPSPPALEDPDLEEEGEIVFFDEDDIASGLEACRLSLTGNTTQNLSSLSVSYQRRQAVSKMTIIVGIKGLAVKKNTISGAVTQGP
ncbi:unnamed protein product [Dovyalis caffra]|uniref:Uncharacterized protein n=1 Tax=Dovyalis caffra TaxID=77055 RepID=A0AAV1SLX5_9ROSI|nr:unnamed protein product [Dovyalis caffra]